MDELEIDRHVFVSVANAKSLRGEKWGILAACGIGLTIGFIKFIKEHWQDHLALMLSVAVFTAFWILGIPIRLLMNKRARSRSLEIHFDTRRLVFRGSWSGLLSAKTDLSCNFEDVYGMEYVEDALYIKTSYGSIFIPDYMTDFRFLTAFFQDVVDGKYRKR